MIKITDLTIDLHKYTIALTEHACNRILDRNIDTLKVINAIKSIAEYLKTIKKTGTDEAIIIDTKNNISIVFAIYPDSTLKVITIIDNSNVFVKNHTKIFNI
jgi:hypothetical protein